MRRLFLAALAVAATAASAEEPEHEPLRFSEDVFAGTARGPYRTGTLEELWVDAQRDETTTSDPGDKRHLMVQIWYPAVFQGNPERAPYALHRGLYKADIWVSADGVATVRTTSVLKASVAAEPKAFPVLIYNPGGGNAHFTGTFQAEFLASQGYVVVGVGHTGLNNIERFPDGYVYKPDVNDPWLSEAESKTLSPEEAFRAQIRRFTERMMPIHVQDIHFVLDRLQVWNATRGNRFHGRLDLEHVGAFGWSLGGALSLQASRDEPRIQAAINLDGTLFTDVAETGTHRPVMIMTQRPEDIAADASASDREIGALDQARFWQLFARSDNDWYRLTLARTNHEHFSDGTLAEPVQPQYMHPRLAHDIINAYTLEFFDKYLRGRTQTPLLDGTSSYPEATLVRKPR